MATPSNSPLLPSMHGAGNFVLEFPSINSPILTLTHARAKLVVCSTDLARMRHCENRRDCEFMLGNSRTKLPDAMHAGQERWVWRGRGLAASAAPVVRTIQILVSFETNDNHSIRFEMKKHYSHSTSDENACKCLQEGYSKWREQLPQNYDKQNRH